MLDAKRCYFESMYTPSTVGMEDTIKLVGIYSNDIILETVGRLFLKQHTTNPILGIKRSQRTLWV